jgi:hypothetical protein
MASDLLLDSLRGLLTPDTISRFATTTGESAPTVSRALTRHSLSFWEGSFSGVVIRACCDR